MKLSENVSSTYRLCVFTCMTFFLQGCVSLQIPTVNGRPTLIGFGYTSSLGGAKGQVYQIVAPGLSLRVGSDAPGISFGWHELRLFYPAAQTNINSPVQSVAFQTKCVGFDFSPVGVMAGSENIFGIPLPNRGKHVIQWIVYAENNPTNTVVELKEIK
jgi:hypothetical protein